jgi:hypothetical protein
LLVVFAVARAAINWFPMDEPGTKWTRAPGSGRSSAAFLFAIAWSAVFAVACAVGVR